MKAILAILTIILSTQSFAGGFKSHYEAFTCDQRVNEFKVVNKTRTIGPRSVRKYKLLRFKVDGSIASCGALSFRELFPKFKIKINECSEQKLDVSVQYLRTAPCDMAMIKDNQKLRVRIPKNCPFNANSGEVYLTN